MADLDRLAGPSTWLALVALVLSAIALGLFFGGAGQIWGPVNDALIGVAVVAMIPAVVAVDRIAGDHGAPWTRLVTVVAIAGILVMAIGQTLLIAGALSLEGSYVTGGVGVIPFIAWIGLVAVLALVSGVLPRPVGWLAAATIAGIVAESLIATVSRGPVLWISSVALVVVLAAWLASLANALGPSAELATS